MLAFFHHIVYYIDSEKHKQFIQERKTKMKRSKATQDMVNYFNVDARVNEWNEKSTEHERIMVENLLLQEKCYRGFNLYNAYIPIKNGEPQPVITVLATIENPKIEGYELVKMNTKPFIQYY